MQCRYQASELALSFIEGGKAKDPVVISVQDSTGKNNAGFSTMPDGEISLMQTFLFNSQCRSIICEVMLTVDSGTDPERDSSMEVGVVLHEMAHGLTNRMVGGGTAKCLQSTEARGLGEG